MSEDRLILAIGRLERALSRVEAAAGRPVRTHDDAALQSLSERHEKLKSQVESAIEALDRLIAKG
ncbi:hypothetical protein [Sphingomonas sp. LaA6.9]|uniref:hypothetical protein n=1 Tax=Sphingomonas sp. LaA6.9 TaxID=2919914 RepID=UPI001F4F944B|nr:hypothetical protein [Sphingomonas sp. LaA6.9]MCJ8156018.1 hypothetical protein [Sphingomonas sp. LaA6.9]